MVWEAGLSLLDLREDRAIGSRLCRPARQPGGSGYSDSKGAFSYHERQISAFRRKKITASYYTSKTRQRSLEHREGKPTTATATMLASVVSSHPFKILPGRVSAYFSPNVSPAWRPSDSGRARCQCGHCTLGHREGSEGGIKINLFF